VPTAPQARYLYHIAAFAPNKYARERVLLLRSVVFVVVAAPTCCSLRLGRIIAPASIEATPGAKNARADPQHWPLASFVEIRSVWFDAMRASFVKKLRNLHLANVDWP
jgi:hypothetical protein